MLAPGSGGSSTMLATGSSRVVRGSGTVPETGSSGVVRGGSTVPATGVW